jgi:hypothetical protein
MLKDLAGTLHTLEVRYLTNLMNVQIFSRCYIDHSTYV